MLVGIRLPLLCVLFAPGYPWCVQAYPHAPGTPHSGQPSPGSMGSGVEEAGGSPHAWGRVPASPLGGNPVSAAAPNLPSLSLFLSLSRSSLSSQLSLWDT